MQAVGAVITAIAAMPIDGLSNDAVLDLRSVRTIADSMNRERRRQGETAHSPSGLWCWCWHLCVHESAKKFSAIAASF